MNRILALLDDNGIRGGRLWTYIFLAHGAAAGCWWWMMPGGFPWTHARFWVNQVFPLMAIATSALGFYGLSTKRLDIVKGVIVAIIGFWNALFLIACLIFPISAMRFGIPVAVIVGAIWLASLVRSPIGGWKSLSASGLIVALLIGGSLPLTQRAPDPSTTPRNFPVPAISAMEAAADQQKPIRNVASTFRINPDNGTVAVSMFPLSIDVSPLLSFESRSPDRCWTIFARASQRTMPKPRLQAERHVNGRAIYRFAGELTHTLQVWNKNTETDCQIEVFAELKEPVFSHLNSYCDLSILGHKQLSIAFSPCLDVRVDIEPSDYPVGRPARFAYLDATRVFHVVEATSGEKGPFRNLASGPLREADELSISLYDDSKRVGTIAFVDWGNQASTELSPTAGWGVPMNAIEFRREGNLPTSLVTISLTLAGTSVGRGWDSVGHRAGVYRNRLRFESGH